MPFVYYGIPDEKGLSKKCEGDLVEGGDIARAPAGRGNKQEQMRTSKATDVILGGQRYCHILI